MRRMVGVNRRRVVVICYGLGNGINYLLNCKNRRDISKSDSEWRIRDKKVVVGE